MTFSRSSEQTVLLIREMSEVAAARRMACSLGQRLGFNEPRLGQLALVVTEAATNIVKHAAPGEILLRPLQCGSQAGIEILALDDGPGMFDLSLQMEDGQSSKGSYGVGLGALKRLSQEFDIFTLPQQGSVLRMALWADGEMPSASHWDIGAICLPLAGQEACGDAWAISSGPSDLAIMVSDGLGHGADAAMASQLAVDSFEMSLNKDAYSPPEKLISTINKDLHGSRGAAIAVAQIDKESKLLEFSGVGNISAGVFNGTRRKHLISHNGIVGSNIHKLTRSELAWDCSALFIAHSDGINTRWSLGEYPGLEQCHPGIIAGILYRDFNRHCDDVCVVILRVAF